MVQTNSVMKTSTPISLTDHNSLIQNINKLNNMCIFKKKCENLSGDNYLREYDCFKKTRQEPYHQSTLMFSVLFVLSLVPVIIILCKCLSDSCKYLCCNWILMLFLIIYAVIILIATIIIVRNVSPYWIKVAELNDKQIERLTRLAEDRLEYERLSNKTAIDIMARQAKVNMEKELKS